MATAVEQSSAVGDDQDFEALDPDLARKGVRVPVLKNVVNDPTEQWAAWFRCLYPDGVSPLQFATAIGRSRSVVYRWLCGEAIPSISEWGAIARQCKQGQNPWTLAPPSWFLEKIGIEENKDKPLPYAETGATTRRKKSKSGARAPK